MRGSERFEHAGFRAIRTFVQRIIFSGTPPDSYRDVKSYADPHYT
jgi:hypothetical protein